jgi:zinc carboxypeptidase/immune inhibitor InhA-like protein
VRRLCSLLFATILSLSAVAPAVARDQPSGSLDMYSATVDAATAGRLIKAGYDIADQEVQADGTVRLSLVLSAQERNLLRREGVTATAIRDAKGKTSRQRALAQAAAGYKVYRSYDQTGGIRDELYDIAKKNAGFVKLVVIGHSVQGREIIALKVTQGAKGMKDGARPAAFFVSNQHAREWISVEVNRRLLRYILDQRRLEVPEIVDLLKTTELWFVITANPDGYQYTFDHERLWRKTLRDNNGDGQITNGDGVDPNRNYKEHWNYDNEGSSGLQASETYRGPSPRSEPETQAMAGLIDRIKPKMLVNYHSFGPLILYPQGWQVGTPDADNPIYTALGGTDANPGIPGFDPGMSAEELYVTNGETTDYADVKAGSIAFTPELEQGCAGCGFVFPDDEALIQAEFLKTLPFSLDVAKSAVDPANPVSHLGNTTKPFYLSQTEVDSENGGLSMFDFTFSKSYGDPQEVRILAKKSLGAVTLKYQINGGAVQSKPTTEWTGGERYGPGNATYYHVVGADVTGTIPTNTVKVWFEGGGATSDSFTYTAVSESGDPVLILAAEDYTGASPVQTPGPHYLSYYQNALAANNIPYDVYDVDANSRTAPDPLGVLSHYQAVIWYTGDDAITREAGRGANNGSRLAIQELYGIRDYLNEGGKVFYTGKFAGHQYAPGHGAQFYDPFTNQQCVTGGVVLPQCRVLSGSGDNVNDVLEYWFGASILNENAGLNPDTGNLYDVVGQTGTALDDSTFGFNGDDSAQNQNHSASFISTSGLLPAGVYPQFASEVAGKYDRPGGPFDPHTGAFYVYSGIADISYKRLMHTVNVPGSGSATMSFWTSFDTEPDWDHVFVEIHTVGQDDWTTLPDINGHTSQATGESCKQENSGGWRTLHPFLDHYQKQTGASTCDPTGTTGAWNAASGSSSGWQQWSVDLSGFAGKQVEVSISYASDWATQGLGVFVDDIVVSTGEGTTSFEDDADDMDGWTMPGQPSGSAPNGNDFARTTAAGFPEGAVIQTADTVYMGFGFEGITDAATRNAVIGKVMTYLLP